MRVGLASRAHRYELGFETVCVRFSVECDCSLSGRGYYGTTRA